MNPGTGRILTTHVGALPGPMEACSGEGLSEDRLRSVVREVVEKQLRCHPQIAWAKLKALADGAALASKELGLHR